MKRLTILFATLSATVIAQDRSASVAALCTAAATPDGAGFVVRASLDGKVIYRAGNGRADLAKGTPLRPEQPFYVASVAKSCTAACVVHLARTGKLSLDDEVGKHLPELGEACRGITLRQLLHHRSGLRDHYELEWLAGRNPSSLDTKAVVALLTRQQARNFAPGADFLYSNTGYLLLAEVVARRSGSSLRTYAQQALFDPLDMRASCFRDASSPAIADAPLAYDHGQPGLEPPRLVGAGGMFSTVDDLDRWLTALSSGTWQPELVRELRTPPALQPEQRRSPQFHPYAGGLFPTRWFGHDTLLLLGGFGGWQAVAVSVPDAHAQVVVLANADLDVQGLARRILATLLDAQEPTRPPNAARPGFLAYRAADGELLFHATRRNGISFLTTLGWKVEVTEQDGVLRSFNTCTDLIATRIDDGALELRIGDERPRRYLPLPATATPADAAAALAGRWHAAELAADVTLVASGGRLTIDAAQLMLPIAPFQPLHPDTWISDTGMQIEVERAADGTPQQLRISTARARGILLQRP